MTRCALTLLLGSVCVLLACDGGPAPALVSLPSMQTVPMLDAQGRARAVVCPGAQGCESNDGGLLVGAAARAITPRFERWQDLDEDGRKDPEEPFEDDDGDGEWDASWVAGFDIGRPAKGVHDDIWTRVVVWSQGDLLIGVVSLDTVGLFQHDVNLIRRAAEPLGFDHLVVATTHNHEAQDTMGIWGSDAGSTGRDPAYIEYVIAQTVDALEEAQDGLAEARVIVAQDAAADLMDDSRLPEVKDPTITALRFDRADGSGVIGTWTLWGNHPEALGGDNQLLTSDYPHYVREALQAHYPGSVAVFSAGNLGGLMNPLHIAGCPDEEGNETCPDGTFELAEYIGSNIAALAIAALDDSGIEVDPDLSFSRLAYFTPVENVKLVLALYVGLIQRDGWTADGQFVQSERVRELPLDELTSNDLLINTEVNLLHLGQLTVVTIPGELYPELWLSGPDGASLVEQPAGADFPEAPIDPPLTALFDDNRIVVPINNANDALGYIIPKAQFDRDEPRAYEEGGQYGEENSTGPDGAHALYDALERLISLKLH